MISAVSQGAIMDAQVFRAWITSAAGVIEANRDHLTQLDAAIGDADPINESAPQKVSGATS